MNEAIIRYGTRNMAYATVFVLLLAGTLPALAQGPKGRSFGFGLQLGDPTAVTFRFWQSRENSWDAAIGTSHLGEPHIHADYLWHFNDVFNSRVVTLYAGVGGVIGFGERGHYVWYRGDKHYDKWWWDEDNRMLFGVKGVFGLNIIPRNSAVDIFLELDPVLGISPAFGFDIMPSVGIRFYP